jgi:hypothetical protein
MFKILIVIVSVAAATYAGPSSDEIKQACYSGEVDKANCAKMLALSIVAHSRDCYASTKGVEAEYTTCTVSFCDGQCNKNEACSGLCQQKAGGLFEKLKPKAELIKVSVHLPVHDSIDPMVNHSAPVLPKVQGSVATKVEKKVVLPPVHDSIDPVPHGNASVVAPKTVMKKAPVVEKKAPVVHDSIDPLPSMVAKKPTKNHSSFMQKVVAVKRAPEDELAKEMTHDLEMNFNKIAPFGKEDTAKELQDHAAKTQDTLVDAVENAEVAEIKRAVFRALTRLRAATIKEFDTIARLETQAIDAYNDAHHYRAENPLTHLHEDEAPVETDKLKSFH